MTINILNKDSKKKPVLIYKTYLCACLKYFRAAFCDGFAETKAQEIDLQDTDLEIFNSFLYWTYHQSLPSEIRRTYTYMKLWIFADKYIVPKLQNYVMRLIITGLINALSGSDPKTLGEAVSSRHNAHPRVLTHDT